MLEKSRHQHSLSEREKQLIELASRGLTDAEMARDLGIAVGTVATYWGRIRSKFGGCSRTELVATAMKESWEETMTELRERANELTARLRRATGEAGGGSNFYQSVVDAAPEAILTVDSRGNIEYMNSAAVEMFGYTQQELEDQPLSLLIPERYRRIHVQHVGEYLEHPGKRRMGEHMSTPARHKSGNEFSIIASLSTIETSDGPIVTCFVHPASEPSYASTGATQSQG